MMMSTLLMTNLVVATGLSFRGVPYPVTWVMAGGPIVVFAWTLLPQRHVRRILRDGRGEDQTRTEHAISDFIGHRYEWLAVAALISFAAFGYSLAYLATRSLLTRSGPVRFSPGDATEILTAVGGLATAIGFAVAAVIKAVALLVHAQADRRRAELGLPPGDPPRAIE
jgi:hypothetical protein